MDSETADINALPVKPSASFTGAPTTAAYNSTFTVTATMGTAGDMATSGIVASPAGSCTASEPPTNNGNGSYSSTVTITNGTGTCTVSATWQAQLDYTGLVLAQTIAETKVTPTITWAAPAAINSGTALSATQLDAKASVPGSLVYSPAAGAVLGPGTQTLPSHLRRRPAPTTQRPPTTFRSR